MTLSEDLTWRGMIKDKTFADINWLDTPRTFYLGADCSADSLTIGNLAIYMLARHLIVHGWKPVLLVGGATSLVGDPGGKDEERSLKSREEITANVAGIKAQVRRLFAGYEFELVDNYDWFKDIGYLEFLRDVGKHYSMSELLQRDFITARLGAGGNGISYAEFSYSLIQGYDYYWLHQHKGVELQIGASDQWGNMLSGVPLLRKKVNKEVHALSMPLVINKKTGKKFGKSEAGAVWLDATKTSPFDFYQFWLNTDDDDAEYYLKRYTMLPAAEIIEITAASKKDPRSRLAQKRLAFEVTQLVHGQQKADAAQEATGHLQQGDATNAILPTVTIEPGEHTVFDLVVAAGLASSTSEARRLFDQGGIKLNREKVTTETIRVHSGDILQIGKRKFVRITPAS